MSRVALRLLPDRHHGPTSYAAMHWAVLPPHDEVVLVHIVNDLFVTKDGQLDLEDPEVSPIWIERRTDLADPITAVFTPLALYGEYAQLLVADARPCQSASAVVGHQLIVLGNGSVKTVSLAFVVDLTTGDVSCHGVRDLPNAWHAMSFVRVPEPFVPRLGHMLCWGGGSNDGSCSDALLRVQMVTEWSTFLRCTKVAVAQSSPTPPGRLYHSATVARDRFMFAFGGAPDAKTTTGDDIVFDDMWIYDMKDDVWSEVRRVEGYPWPSKRGSYALHFVEPFVYLLGGFDGSANLLDGLWRYHLDLGVWECMDFDDASEEAVRVAGRWATSSCFNPHNRTIELAYGFDPSREMTSQRWTVELPSPSLKLLAAEYVARHRKMFHEEDLARVAHIVPPIPT